MERALPAHEACSCFVLQGIGRGKLLTMTENAYIYIIVAM
jgi:hypothetical protein